MPTFLPDEYPILFQKAWRTTELAKDISCLNRDALQNEFEKLVQNAPHRSKKSKDYFVKHSDQESANDSNRHEKILAKGAQEARLLMDASRGRAVPSARLPVSVKSSAIGSGHRQGRSARSPRSRGGLW